jgi:AraC-like DNA-binding protein
MRIERTPHGWKILAPGLPGPVCLKDVSNRCGYRVTEICGELGCSEGYFRRVFLRDTGLSPKQWLMGERMLMARQFLGQGREWVEVAELLGFASPASFRREFQMVYSAPPGRWGQGRRGGDA